MVHLANDEKTLWEGGPGWSNFLGQLLFALLLAAAGVALLVLLGQSVEGVAIASAILIGLGLLLLLIVVVKRAMSRFTVTTQRAIVERGIISRHVFEIELSNVRDLQLRQSFAERVLGTGTLEISSAGRDTAEVVFNGVPSPDQVKELVRQGMRQIGKS